jgi:nicotinamide-nucleotide amidase
MIPSMVNVHERAALVSVGDELVLGQTLDTNSRWMADRLLAAGVVVIEHATVGDDAAAQAAALRRLAARADIIVCSGGLGPTADDLTRRALCEAMEDELVADEVSMTQIRAWYEARGRGVPLNAGTQAMRPSRAQALTNVHGSAPGLYAVVGDSCDVFCLPGPPREMKPMFEQHVMARLRPSSERTVLTRVLHCFGIGESDLAVRLGDLMDRSRNPKVGTTASEGIVSCRIRYEGALRSEEAQEEVSKTEAMVREAAAPYVFGADSQTLPGVVIELLRAKGAKVGVVESCTGGMLGSLLTEVPGSSEAFVGGLLTYSNDQKIALAGVGPELLSAGGPGAVSGETALAMARGGLARLGCDECLAITGIAGPGGGSEAKPVGTVWIALVGKGGRVDCRRFLMGGDRGAIRDWSAKAALGMLRLHLAGHGDAPMLRQVSVRP